MHTTESKKKNWKKWAMKEDGKRAIEQVQRDKKKKKEGNNKDK